MFRQDEAFECVDDGQSCEDRYGTDEIGGADVEVEACGEEILDVGGAVVFAACAFWRLLRKVWIEHQLIDQSGYGAAGLRELRVPIEAPTAACEMLNERVDKNVGGTGIEGKDLRWFAGGGEDGDVGDAAEI